MLGAGAVLPNGLHMLGYTVALVAWAAKEVRSMAVGPNGMQAALLCKHTPKPHNPAPGHSVPTRMAFHDVSNR